VSREEISLKRAADAAREVPTMTVKAVAPAPAGPTKPSAQEELERQRLAQPEHLARDLPSLSPGDVVGRYVVLELIGSGGMGSVYTARDPELDRKVALKLLHQVQGQARLLREAKALARLAHPNVVTAHDVGTYDGRVFLAMEFIDGLTLRQWCALRRRTWREVVNVFAHAARGLAAAHASGIVHRDFKPDNVLIGKDGRVRVLDFGLAGEAGMWPPEEAHADGSNDWSSPIPIMGTPAYMAPEQHLALTTDARTDQFSFCIALWEALFGGRPFQLSTLAALSPRAALPAIPTRSDVPDWLARLVLRGLAFDPGERYASMDTIVAELDAGVRGADSATRIVGRRYALLPSTQAAGLEHTQRALDKLTGNVVTILHVDPPRLASTDSASSRRIAHLRNFQALTTLRHPHLVAVLDGGFDDDGRPYFVLDLREQAEPLLTATRHKPFSLQINLLVQLLRALSFLHRRGMAHGALTSARALVVGGQTKLLNLGVSGPVEQEAVTQKSGHAPRNMARAARDEAKAIAADLEAVGTIARDMFIKTIPFERAPSAAIPPGMVDVNELDVDSRVGAVVVKLLSTDSAAHFRTAADVITALAEATGRSLPVETLETRESFLQAARFVGRDAEFARLRGELKETVAGRGSAWLVGGESGVGKSRLLDELRTFALGQGALVLRGQEESEGGSPYQSWRDALRWLALVSDLEPLEASVLLPLVPDLPSLLERPVPAAPDLDAPSMHARLVEVVLGIFQRQTQPIVLLLEDLQWARSESVKLLHAVAARASDLPLLVVATYRSDERADLPRELGTMRPLPLPRLSPEAIAKLSVSMIGPAGERPDLLTLLRRETEGNAFFLVEVVRALAEEAGTLDRIGAEPLPQKVFVGGMRRVIQRRLDRVREEDRALLRAAAVIGRKIDVPLLSALAPDADVEAWASECIDAAVIERQEGGLRFAHDKLREGLLADLDPAERCALHARVAEAIERLYPDAPERMASLAHHFGQAQNIEKEARYAALAGEQAVQHGAFPEAITLLERALALKVASGAPRLEIAQLYSSLGTASFFLMDFANALTHLSETSAACGSRVPRTRLGSVVILVFELCVQIIVALFPSLVVTKNKARCDELLEASRASARLSNVAIFRNDELGVLLFGLRAVNLAERAGRTNLLSLGLLGFAAGCVGLDRVALRFFDRMHMADAPADELRNIATGTIAEASYLIGVGRLAQADDVLRTNLALCRRIGDRANAAYCEYLLALAAFYRGSLEEARRRVLLSQDKLGDALARHGASFATFEAHLLCIDGRLDDALERLRSVKDLFTRYDRLAEAIWFGVLAMIEVRRGDLAAARGAADDALARVKTSRVIAASGAGLLGGAMEAYLASWEDARAKELDFVPMARKAQRILRFSRSWARVYPIGGPQTLLHEGRALWLAGKETQARSTWEKSLRLAQSMSLGLYQGLAHLELGRSLSAASPRRATHLTKARDCFAAANAVSYGKETEALLAADRDSGAD
jgi:serine/threonine protein kinase/tetratricopeptide (TPR) repeat protein